MELAIIITVALVFAVLGVVAVASIVVGLPGAWMILALAVLIELVDGWWLGPGSATFGWWLLIGCAVVAVIGELFELLAGALGAKTAGSSRNGTIGALIGGVVGAFAGLAIPLPLLGSLIGAVLGTFVGAVIGELHGVKEATVRGALRPATGATVGRILGTLGKVPLAAAIWLVLVIAAFWP